MFETDLNTAIGAIDELFTRMGNPPALQQGELGPVITTYCGNGLWMRTSSYYFNCGVNPRPNVVPPIGEKGHLSQVDGNVLAHWFETEKYRQYRANVLRQGRKYNYTMVVNHNAFNFHLEVG